MDTKPYPSRPGLEEAIKRAGSQSALARRLKRSQPLIHKWLNSKGPLKSEHCVAIEREIGIPRQRLRPDDWAEIWPELSTGQEEGAPHA